MVNCTCFFKFMDTIKEVTFKGGMALRWGNIIMKIKMVFKSGAIVDFVADSIDFKLSLEGNTKEISWKKVKDGVNLLYSNIDDISAIFYEGEDTNE